MLAGLHAARHGKGRVAKLVLIGAVPPIMVKTPANPGGLPLTVACPTGTIDLTDVNGAPDLVAPKTAPHAVPAKVRIWHLSEVALNPGSVRLEIQIGHPA
jgi:hypothetical protein